MSVSVVVPRAGDCPYRERAWQWVRQQYEGLEVVEGWGDLEQWCKAEAVGDALSRATGELLVVADADVWTDQLEIAIETVESGAHQWAVPHRRVRRLTEQGTEQFKAGERDQALTSESHQSVLGGGIVVLSRATYERVPLDPRFVGWGGEDTAWGCALATLAGKPLIVNEPLWHLWHPPQPRMSRRVGNERSDELRGRYVGARTSARQMRDLIEEGRACRSIGSSTRQ